MATKRVIELEAKTDKALEGIEDLKKEIQSLNKQVVDSNKKTEEGLKSVESASKATAKGLRGIGTAIKAIGIGLLLEAFNFFKETLGQNQKVLDLFNTTFEVMSLAFNDFINFLSDNFSVVTGFFKATFEDPIGSIKRFGQAIFDGVIARVKQAIEAFGLLASAAGKLISGNFAGAMMDAKEAGKEFFDVITGQEGGFEAVTGAINKTIDAVVNYTKSTIDAAKANVELNKQAEVARVLQQGLVETFDRQAEKLRQVRDEERNTIADRIKANNDLKAVLDEQEAAMLKQVEIQIASAQAAYDKNQNQENYIALLEATQEKEAVLAQIEGFRSEQLANDLALQRELIELTESQVEAENERAISQQEFLAEQIEGEYLRLEALRAVAVEEARIEEERLTKKRDQYKQGTQAYVDANNELLAFQQENNQKQVDLERQLQLSKQQLVSEAIGNLITIVGENSKFGKGLAIVQAIRDTYVGANKALAAAPPPFNFISAAAVIAGGIKNVKEITSAQDPQAPNIPGARSAGAASIPALPSPPQINTVGASGVNQLAQSINQQTKQPIKAYVVAGEVSSAQSLERNAVKEASI